MRPLTLTAIGCAAAGMIAAALVSSRTSTVDSLSEKTGSSQDSQFTVSTDQNSTEALLADVSRCVTDDTLGREIGRTIRLIQQRPVHSDSWVSLGDALLQHSRDTLDVSLYGAIKKIYFKAHELDATNTDALIGLAWATGATHRFDESVKWAELALQQNPDLPAAHGILGDAAVELGSYDEASRHYQKMLDLRPDMGSYSRAAHLLYLQGNVPRAMALMRQAINAGGNHAEHTAWCVAELTTMLCREGAVMPALNLVEPSLKRAPDNAQLLAAAGLARMCNGDDVGAINAYERSISCAPQHGSLAALHDLYVATGRNEDAQHIADRIQQMHIVLKSQRVFGGEGQLARFLADRGENLDEAVRLAESEYSHHHTAMATDTLAWALHRAGRTPEAVKLVKTLLKHRVPDAAMLYHAGMIEEAAGNAYDARRHLAAALSREPRFNPVHAPIAQAALVRLGSAADSGQLAAVFPTVSSIH